MTSLTPVVDHVVITVGDQLDEASALFRRLGFQLSERGHHSLGSSNHLAIFDENYLELLGYLPERGNLREDLWQSPRGLSGLVWKTDDADAVYQHLQQQQLAGDPPAAFFRPVTLPDGSEHQARFRTTRLRHDTVANGRSFFCQHLTPEAVWQPAWQQHRNAVTTISGFIIAADKPAVAARVYSQLFDTTQFISTQDDSIEFQAGVTRVRFTGSAQARATLGPLPDDYNGTPRMAALEFTTTSLDQVRQSLLAGDIRFSERENTLRVSAEDGFNLALIFSVKP